MSILAGMAEPDEGEIRIDDATVRISSPRRAIDLGIGMVYQHATLIPTLTVLENLMLGDGRALTLDEPGARARLAEMADVLGVEVDPDAETGSLSLGQQQQIEIVKALWRGSKVLILDEPTSMLTPRGVAELADALERLKGHGLAVVFITHKLHEATAIGDRVTVLKQGRVSGRLDPEELAGAPDDELAGRDRGDHVRWSRPARSPSSSSCRATVEGHRPRRALPEDAVLELDELERDAAWRRARRARRLAAGAARRDPGHRGRRRQRPARAGRGDRRTAAGRRRRRSASGTSR